jgi:ABC-2 type transport system permease protein
MNKITTIIQREYLSRVKKRSFIVMTILGPILMAGLMVAPLLVSQMSDRTQEVALVDDSMLFYDRFRDANNIRFTHLPASIDQAVELMQAGRFDAVLHIPEIALEAPSSMRLFSEKATNLNTKLYIENILRQEFESLKLGAAGIDREILASIQTPVNIHAIRIKKDGLEQADHPEVSMGLGFVSGLLIYIFIFLFGSQVLRGVLEEKTSRIVEIIVSSVRPFQLMMGKIVGVGLVGLTQFLIWIVLTFAIVGSVRAAAPGLFRFTPGDQVYVTSSQILNPQELQARMETVQQLNTPAGEILAGLAAINFPLVILAFIFFFLGGYLLYGALFASIGAAVDNEADTQQFMLPVTIPLLFAFIMAQMVMANPSGPVAFWLSIIPLTSPVIMMVRIPFGVPYAELLLSAALLVGGFILTTWLASRIYRTGILMYGKKVSYAELWKWIRHH